MGSRRRAGADGVYARYVKPVFDFWLAVAGLICTSPLWALIPLAIKLDSAGPVLYRQTRIGRRGRPFHLLKFRTMIVGAEWLGSGVKVEPNDPRVTRVGRILRRFSLDELPQLVNVLRGEMSLVGPRPTLAYQVEQYDARQRGRLLVRPGMTGLAQVRGRNALSWPERIELDLYYVRNVSFALDTWILLATIPVLLRKDLLFSREEYWRHPPGQELGGSAEPQASEAAPPDASKHGANERTG